MTVKLLKVSLYWEDNKYHQSIHKQYNPEDISANVFLSLFPLNHQLTSLRHLKEWPAYSKQKCSQVSKTQTADSPGGKKVSALTNIRTQCMHTKANLYRCLGFINIERKGRKHVLTTRTPSLKAVQHRKDITAKRANKTFSGPTPEVYLTQRPPNTPGSRAPRLANEMDGRAWPRVTALMAEAEGCCLGIGLRTSYVMSHGDATSSEGLDF